MKDIQQYLNESLASKIKNKFFEFIKKFRKKSKNDEKIADKNLDTEIFFFETVTKMQDFVREPKTVKIVKWTIDRFKKWNEDDEKDETEWYILEEYAFVEYLPSLWHDIVQYEYNNITYKDLVDEYKSHPDIYRPMDDKDEYFMFNYGVSVLKRNGINLDDVPDEVIIKDCKLLYGRK